MKNLIDQLVQLEHELRTASLTQKVVILQKQLAILNEINAV